MSKKTRRQYTEQFKADAVRLLEEEGYGLTEAGRRLGVDCSCLARWRRERRDRPQGGGEPAMASEGDAELRQLREEVRKLRMERDILKKAAAFFAKESS
jgi:transposase